MYKLINLLDVTCSNLKIFTYAKLYETFNIAFF